MKNFYAEKRQAHKMGWIINITLLISFMICSQLISNISIFAYLLLMLLGFINHQVCFRRFGLIEEEYILKFLLSDKDVSPAGFISVIDKGFRMREVPERPMSRVQKNRICSGRSISIKDIETIAFEPLKINKKILLADRVLINDKYYYSSYSTLKKEINQHGLRTLVLNQENVNE